MKFRRNILFLGNDVCIHTNRSIGAASYLHFACADNMAKEAPNGALMWGG